MLGPDPGHSYNRINLTLFRPTDIVMVYVVGLFAFAVIWFLPDCSGSNGLSTDRRPTNLEAAKGLWTLSGTQNYQYTLKHECFCSPDEIRPKTIIVWDGSVVMAFYADDNSPIDIQKLKNPRIVEDLFQYVDDAHGFAEASPRDESLAVRYNSSLGYPESISFNRDIPDGYSTYTVTDFKVVD